METRTLAENGTPVTKEKTVAFSGHRTNRIAKFTADREKLFSKQVCSSLCNSSRKSCEDY